MKKSIWRVYERTELKPEVRSGPKYDLSNLILMGTENGAWARSSEGRHTEDIQIPSRAAFSNEVRLYCGLKTEVAREILRFVEESALQSDYRTVFKKVEKAILK